MGDHDGEAGTGGIAEDTEYVPVGKRSQHAEIVAEKEQLQSVAGGGTC